ncbi:MAG TPA: hypothetical protein VF147_04655 [Vicinamibacterales bacterium]
MATHDEEIDELFRLPLDQFTAARNALAKRAGAKGAAIRELTKPPVAAWAVNQLYWRDRDAYAALIDAAEELRRTHKAVLGGKGGDLRAAGRAHDQALDRAVKATTAILTGEGHPASDATRQAIVSTLRALPGDEPPGRLTRTLQPGGFEMLAGFPIAKTAKLAPAPTLVEPTPSKASARSPRHSAEREGGPAKSKAEQAREAKALAKAKEAATAARLALQRAEHDAKREEFERARAAREAEKAAAAVTRAREAREQAQQELEDAEEAASAAETNRERAEKRAEEADRKRAAAEAKAQTAAEELKALEG